MVFFLLRMGNGSNSNHDSVGITTKAQKQIAFANSFSAGLECTAAASAAAAARGSPGETAAAA